MKNNYLKLFFLIIIGIFLVHSFVYLSTSYKEGVLTATRIINTFLPFTIFIVAIYLGHRIYKEHRERIEKEALENKKR